MGTRATRNQSLLELELPGGAAHNQISNLMPTRMYASPRLLHFYVHNHYSLERASLLLVRKRTELEDTEEDRREQDREKWNSNKSQIFARERALRQHIFSMRHTGVLSVQQGRFWCSIEAKRRSLFLVMG